MQLNPQAPFNWRHDCRFELLIDGTEFFPRILQYIEQAQTNIDIGRCRTLSVRRQRQRRPQHRRSA